MAQFLYRFGTPMFFIYMGISVAFLLTIESIFNGGFTFAVKILWIPLAVAVFGVTWWCRKDFEAILGRPRKAWITAIILYPILLLMSWPYVMAFNALMPSGGDVIYEGPVTKKWTSKGRSTGYQIVVRDEVTQEDVTLSTSKNQFEKLSVGDQVRETFSIGGLGIPFRWRYGK